MVKNFIKQCISIAVPVASFTTGINPVQGNDEIVILKDFDLNSSLIKTDLNQNSEISANTNVSDLETIRFQIGNDKILTLAKKAKEPDAESLELLCKIKGGSKKNIGPAGKAHSKITKASQQRRSLKSNSESNIFGIPGASGYVTNHQIYCQGYHRNNPREKSCRPKVQKATPTDNDNRGFLNPSEPTSKDTQTSKDIPTPRTAPRLNTMDPASPEQSQLKEPRYVSSPTHDSEMMITNKDARKWMADEERTKTPIQATNEQHAKVLTENIIKNADEVVKATDIQRADKKTTVFIQNDQVTGEKNMVLVHQNRNKPDLRSNITEAEYQYLLENKKVNLFDMRRNSQTRIMDEKSRIELEGLNMAKEQGCLTGLINERRPINKTEFDDADFVAMDQETQKMIPIEMKKVHFYKSKRGLNVQTADINNGVLESLNKNTDMQVLCDISEIPSYLTAIVRKNITRGLTHAQLLRFNFVY